LDFRDRVVQHALIHVIEPILAKAFIADTYACQKRKGTHAGIRCLRGMLVGQSGKNYFLKADIAKYFPSVDIEILKAKIRKRIKCKDTLRLIDIILDSSPGGLPIGNLTSQLFANYYLSDLDHFIKEKLGEKKYIRYMDDFIIISHSLEKLKNDYCEIVEQLELLKLNLNGKTSIAKIKQGIDFLGYRCWPGATKLRKRNIVRNRRKFHKILARLAASKTNRKIINRSVASLHGYTKYAACKTTKEHILKGIKMPLKMRFDSKTGKIEEIPGLWIDDADGIARAGLKVLREQVSIEDELKILRDAVILIGREHLPQRYLEAISKADTFVAEKTAESDCCVELDMAKWKEAELSSLVKSLGKIGLVVPKEVTTVADLKTFVAGKASNVVNTKP